MKEGQAGPIMTAEQVAQVSQLMAQLEQPVKTIIWNTLTGLLGSYQGIPPHAVLTMAAMQAGLFMGQVIQGELATVIQIRKGFKDAFDEGVRKTPPNVVPMPGRPANLQG